MLGDLIRSGVTTLLDIAHPIPNGSLSPSRAVFVPILRPDFREAALQVGAAGSISSWNNALGQEAACSQALAFVDEARAHASSIDGVVAPSQIKVLPGGLIQEAVAAARKRQALAFCRWRCATMAERELLRRTGEALRPCWNGSGCWVPISFWGPASFFDRHLLDARRRTPRTTWRLAASETSVAHYMPRHVRSDVALESLAGGIVAHGVNVGIGAGQLSIRHARGDARSNAG